MLTIEKPRSGTRRLLSAAVMATGLLVAMAPMTLAGAGTSELDPARPGPATTETALAEAQARVTELRVEVDDLTDRNVELEADNSTLQQTVDSLSRERDQLADSMSHFEDQYEPLEADYQLLLELRKRLPDTRPEAEAHLERVGRLALRSDPARLGQLVDRVKDAAPSFLDWRFTQYANTQEATEAYVSSGANAFETVMEELRAAVLLSVANRLDGLLNVLDDVR